MSKRAESTGYLEQRHEALEAARQITRTALDADRELTGEEASQRTALVNRAQELKQLSDLTLEQAAPNSDALDATRPDPDAMEPTSRTNSVDQLVEKGRENMQSLFDGRETGTIDELRNMRGSDAGTVHWAPQTAITATPEYASAFYSAMAGAEITADQQALLDVPRQAADNFLSADDTRAGVLTPPMSLIAGILKARDAALPLSARITKKLVRGAESLGKTRRAAKASTFKWGSETTRPTKDEALGYDRRVLTPQHWSSAVQIGRVLLRRGFLNIENEIIGEVKIDIAEGIEQARITGDGNGKPLGLFTASENGITSARDVVAGTTTLPTWEGITKAKYLALRYWGSGEYLLAPSAHEALAVDADTTGQPRWRESTRAGEPDRFAGRPVDLHEFFPNTVAVDAYFGMFADFSYFWQADDLDMEILRDIDIHNNVVDVVVRGATDAMPMLEEAFVRLKYAAS